MSPEYHGRVRPGKASSLLGMIVGIGFVIFGLALFGEVERLGRLPPTAFLLLWVVAAGGLVVFSAYCYFSGEGASVVDVTLGIPGLEPAQRECGFEVRLRRLQGLRDDGLINQQESEQKRAQIMAEKWQGRDSPSPAPVDETRQVTSRRPDGGFPFPPEYARPGSSRPARCCRGILQRPGRPLAAALGFAPGAV